MTYAFDDDIHYRAIVKELELLDGLMKDAWVDYLGERWHPILIRDRRSGKRGFEVNYSGKWGKNVEVGRQKLELDEFMLAIAANSIPQFAGIRCKRPDEMQRNARRFSELRMSSRLTGIVIRIRS
jgi:hypothetical protein